MKYVLLFLLCLQVHVFTCWSQVKSSGNAVLQAKAAKYIISNNDSAKIIINQLLANDGGNYENVLLHGMYMANKKPAVAKKDFRKASDICNCSEAYNCLAGFYTEPVDYDSAILILKRSLAANPKQPKVCALIGNDYFYEAISDSTLLDSVIVYDYRAYLMDTTDVNIIRQYAYFLSFYKSCEDSTMGYFAKLRRLDPDDSIANFYIGNCLLNKGSIFSALNLLIDAEKSNPNSSKYNFVLANCYLQTYDFCQFNYYIKKAIACNSDDSMANIYFDMLLDNVSKCAPEHTYDTVLHYIQLGDAMNLPIIKAYKHSIDSINLLIANFHESTGPVDSLGKLAQYYFYAKNYKLASACIDDILHNNVMDTDLYIQRVTLYMELGQLNEAQNFISSKLKMTPSNYLLFLSAVVYMEQQQVETAKGIFSSLLKSKVVPELNDDIKNYLLYIDRNKNWTLTY